MTLARDERADLVEFLATLAPAQWSAPTLCDRWRVRDVVAHVYSYDDLGFGALAVRVLRSGFSVDGVNALGLADYAGRTDGELLATARAHPRPRGLSAWRAGRVGLTDAMIHHQDIRRRLGRPRTIPAERLAAALDTARSAPSIGLRQRTTGLTLTATDLDWSTGSGPLVTGPGEALLMAVAGRPAITDELTGPGVATLRERTGR